MVRESKSIILGPNRVILMDFEAFTMIPMWGVPAGELGVELKQEKVKEREREREEKEGNKKGKKKEKEKGKKGWGSETLE